MPNRNIMLPLEEIANNIVENADLDVIKDMAYKEALKFLKDIEDYDILSILPPNICLKPTLKERLDEIFDTLKDNLTTMNIYNREVLLLDEFLDSIHLHRDLHNTPMVYCGGVLKAQISRLRGN